MSQIKLNFKLQYYDANSILKHCKEFYCKKYYLNQSLELGTFLSIRRAWK